MQGLKGMMLIMDKSCVSRLAEKARVRLRGFCPSSIGGPSFTVGASGHPRC